MIGSISNPVARSLANSQFGVFQGTLDRNLLNVKLAMAERMQKEIDDLAFKYDGTRARSIEDHINALGNQKDEIAKIYANVESALKDILDVKDKLAEVKGYANSGDTAQFNVGLNSLNSIVGSARIRPDNYLGNTGSGSWGVKTYTATGGSISVDVQTAFLGTDYQITLNTGEKMTPDFDAETLNGAGVNIDFANLQLDSLAGDAITFTDTATNTQYTGTIATGGVDVKSAWLYNNFAAQADIDSAKTDVDSAMREVTKKETTYNGYKAQLKAALDAINTKMSIETDEFERINEEELDARLAERRAIQSRFDLATHSLALTAMVRLSTIQGLFFPPVPGEKKPLFSVINEGLSQQASSGAQQAAEAITRSNASISG